MPQPTLQRLTLNLAGDSVRDDKLEGEEYWVAPLVMMMECVANGSEGALFYPAAEIEKWAPAWNYKPIVTPDHPTGGSACTPEFLNDHKVGVVLNSQYDTKLRAEGWFNKKRTTKISPKVANALKQRRMMELSTGLYVDPVPQESTFNGEKYTAVARNYRPDHLAILPDKIGAFSIRKGAGLLQLNEASFSEITCAIDRSLQALYMDAMKEMPSLYPPYTRDVYEDHAVFSFGGKLWDVSYTKSADGEVKLKGKPSEVVIETTYVPVENEEKPPEEKKEDIGKQVDLYMNRHFSTKQKKRMAKAGQVMQDGSFPILNEEDLKVAIKAIGRAKNPAAARRHISNRAATIGLDNLLPKGWVTTRRTAMTKAELIESLIKNEQTKWEEDDRKALEAFNEDQLAKMLPDEVEKPAFSFNTQAELDAAIQKGVDGAITKNAAEVKEKAEAALKKAKPEEKPVENKEMTPEEFMARMPPQFRAIHNQAMNSYKTEIERLAGVIIANANNKFTKDQLIQMGTTDIDMLRNMAVLAQNKDDVQQNNVTTAQNFLGMGVPFQVLNAAKPSQQEQLNIPVYNLEKIRSGPNAK